MKQLVIELIQEVRCEPSIPMEERTREELVEHMAAAIVVVHAGERGKNDHSSASGEQDHGEAPGA